MTSYEPADTLQTMDRLIGHVQHRRWEAARTLLPTATEMAKGTGVADNGCWKAGQRLAEHLATAERPLAEGSYNRLTGLWLTLAERYMSDVRVACEVPAQSFETGG